MFGQLLCPKKLKCHFLPLILNGEIKGLKSLETEIGFATFFFKKKKRRTDTNSAIPHGACFSVIVEYFRNKYRDNLAFYFEEKIYGS